MPRRRDDETGQYQEVYSDEVILDLLEGTRLSTSEIANSLNCHRTTAHDLLVELREEGEIVANQVGNTFIWELD
jgi:DNA-binding GntR family transcriptional regulator